MEQWIWSEEILAKLRLRKISNLVQLRISIGYR